MHRLQGMRLWALGDAQGDGGIAIGQMIAADKPDAFFYLGDVYETGTIEEFGYYDQAFGALKPVTHPIPGNHEYGSNLSGFKHYWPDVPTAYGFEQAGWLFVFFDSNLPVAPGTPQHDWIAQQAKDWGGPVVLCFHHHLYSAGGHGDQPQVQPAVDLFSDRCCVLLSGHTPNMQRFKPQGHVTQFVMGSGGRTTYPVNMGDPRLAWACEDWGALRMVAQPGSLHFEFISHTGTVLDSGVVHAEPRITLL